jgi:hypothetical protein
MRMRKLTDTAYQFFYSLLRKFEFGKSITTFRHLFLDNPDPNKTRPEQIRPKDVFQSLELSSAQEDFGVLRTHLPLAAHVRAIICREIQLEPTGGQDRQGRLAREGA